MTYEDKLITSALAFSREKHKLQTREDAAHTPYITHPIGVYKILKNVGRVTDPEVLAAALLHETLEDTETTPTELLDAFGERVLSIVRKVTDDQSLPAKIRKEIQIQKAPQLSREAAVVRLADKIHNSRDVMRNPPVGWSREKRLQHLTHAEQVVTRLPCDNKALREYFEGLVSKGRLTN